MATDWLAAELVACRNFFFWPKLVRSIMGPPSCCLSIYITVCPKEYLEKIFGLSLLLCCLSFNDHLFFSLFPSYKNLSMIYMYIVYLSNCLSIYLSVYLSAKLCPIHHHFCTSGPATNIHPSVSSSSISLSFWLSIYLSIYVCLYILLIYLHQFYLISTWRYINKIYRHI